ncbi:hypothetical protein P3342_013585 [Pyrenophora teres f. teres]|nr:hypothetical protein P3342_013585 [Pyrenophora teres f. teres]
MRELHDIERHRAYSMTASDHITPHPAPLPSTFQDIPVAKPRYRRSAPEHEPLPVIASEKFTEMTRRNREEDRISNLPLEEQPLENAKEMERRRRWDKVYASRIAATQNDGRNTSSTTTNAIISTPVPTTTPTKSECFTNTTQSSSIPR